MAFGLHGRNAQLARPAAATPASQGATHSLWARNRSHPTAADGYELSADDVNEMLGQLRNLLVAIGGDLAGATGAELATAMTEALASKLSIAEGLAGLDDGGGYVRMTEGERTKLASLPEGYRGSFLNLAALVAAHPAGAAGSWAILQRGSTSNASVALWDADNATPQWVDSGLAPSTVDWAATNAAASAATAAAQAAAAQAAAEASGAISFYDTKAAADAAVAGLAAGAIVEVLADETRSNARTRYRKEGGVLVYKLTLPAAEVGVAVTWYVDSVSGNDGNSGLSSAAPLKTLAALEALSAAGDVVFLKRGSVFRDDLAVKNRQYVLPYGMLGPAPIVSGADLLDSASFALHAGSVYKISLPSIPSHYNPYASVTANGVLMVWEGDTRLGFSKASGGFASLAALEASADPGFWWDAPTTTLYVRTTDGSNPASNGRVYQASTRTLAIHGGDGFLVEGIVGERAGIVNTAGQQGYAILGYKGGHYRDCTGRLAWNHAVGVANAEQADDLIFERCLGEDCERFTAGAPPPTIFVAYKSSPHPSRVVFKDCKARQPTASSGTYQEIGFFGHGSSLQLVYEGNNYAENVQYGVQLLNDGSDRAWNECRGIFSARNVATGVYANDGRAHDLTVAVDTAVFAVDARVTGTRVTGRAIDCTNGVQAYGSVGAPVTVDVADMIIARRQAPASHIDGAGVATNGYGTINCRRTLFHNLGRAWAGGGSNDPVGVSNNNWYSGCFRIWSDTGLSPDYGTTLAGWQSASGQDANSVASAATVAYSDLRVVEPNHHLAR